jgi:hypothetical protein
MGLVTFAGLEIAGTALIASGQLVVGSRAESAHQSYLALPPGSTQGEFDGAYAQSLRLRVGQVALVGVGSALLLTGGLTWYFGR